MFKGFVKINNETKHPVEGMVIYDTFCFRDDSFSIEGIGSWTANSRGLSKVIKISAIVIKDDNTKIHAVPYISIPGTEESKFKIIKRSDVEFAVVEA